MSGVYRQGELNTASLVNNDVYVIVAVPANTTVQGVDAGVVGLVGTASWGPTNTPIQMGGPADVRLNFGAQAIATNDMPTDANIVFQLGVPTVVGIRVTDTTDVKATGALVTAGKGTVTLAGTFHIGDTTNVTFGGVLTSYAATAADATLAGVAASLATALNGNLSFANIGYAYANGAVVNLISINASNATTLVSTVTGGGATITATASAGTLAGGGTAMGTITALYTGTDGNNITFDFGPGNNTTAAAPTWNVVISLNSTVAVSELFTNIREGVNFAGDLTSAFQNGQGTTRPPSQLVRYVPNGSPGTTAPIGAQTAMTGGTNGDASLTSAQALGTNQAYPATGAFALKGQGTQKWGLCGNTDSTTWATQLSIAKSIGSLAVLAFPANTSTAAAIAAKNAGGVVDYQIAYVKDWVQFLDTVNGVNRLISPMAFALGRIASLTPEQSPGNKPVGLVLNTDRSLSIPALVYGPDEAGLLTKNGILFITNPCPGGAFWGLRHGRNSVGDTNRVIGGIEYTNMTNFLSYSFAGSFGEFIDQNQTGQADDPVRKTAFEKLTKFLSRLKNTDKLIESFDVDMDFGAGKTNTADTVAAGYMIAKVYVKYKGVVRFFLITLIGGNNVDVTAH